MGAHVDRRRFIQGGLLAGCGAVAGAVATRVPRLWRPSHLPFTGGYAPAADRPGYERQGMTTVTWRVRTDEPVVAFTFDDGPGPRWTPMVLDTLDRYRVPATFFLVGQHLADHPGLVRGRVDRHEIGNHSWSHPDLAKLDAPAVRRQLVRAHETIHKVTGREPRLFRPPYGHLGGSTLLAADDLDYRLILWSRKMSETTYRHHPEGQVREIVTGLRPGDVVLAHDVGSGDRLVALRRLGEMFDGLRARGFRFVTVSELLALEKPAAAA